MLEGLYWLDLGCCILLYEHLHFIWMLWKSVFLNGRIPGTSWSNTDRFIAEDGAHRWRSGKSRNVHFKCVISFHCWTTIVSGWCAVRKTSVALSKHHVWLSVSLCEVTQILSFPWIFCELFCSPALTKTSVLCSENIWRWLIDHIVILGLVTRV